MADVTCHSCGASVPVGTPMCRQCGAVLVGQPPAASPSVVSTHGGVDADVDGEVASRTDSVATYRLTAPDVTWEVTDTLRVGRDPAWSNVGDDLDERDLVSRRHATFWVEHGDLFVQDEGSTNGTFVNGEACIVGRPHRLAVGDRVRMSSHLQFTVAADDTGAE